MGTALDPQGKEGMTGLCMDLVGEGTRHLDKSALEDRKADLGASISIGAGRETSSLSLRVTKERLAGALDLAAQLITEPGLRKEDLERLRAQWKASVIQQRGNTDAVAGRVLAPIVYGKRHPFGHVVTEQTLDNVSEKDCADVAAQLKPEGATLIAVGDVTAAELKQLFEERMLASWRGKAPARPRIGPPSTAKGTIFFVDIPGASQSRVVVAHMGPARNAPDYEATTVMTQVLGSGLPSRIVQNLREKNGFTYGARAGFGYARGSSLFTLASSVKTEVTGKALREIAGELKGMTSRPVTDEEMNRERWGNVRALPGRFGTGSGTLGSVAELLFYDLPLDTWATMPARLEKLTTADVNRAVKDRLKAEGVVVVVAGDRTKIFDDLRAIADEKLFGKGGLVVVDPDGNPVAK
jgi:predicted Zn-dependent peptidase